MALSSGFAEETPVFGSEATEIHSVAAARLKIDNAGRIVIPAEMRAAMQVGAGDMVTAEVVDGEFRIVSPATALARVQAFARRWKADNQGADVVDELIAERHEEARRELDEANRWRRSRGLPPLK